MSFQCAALSGASSGGAMMACAVSFVAAAGIRPKPAAMMPSTISAMPQYMPVSMGMPARTKPMLRPIQNIGRCKRTPALTIAEPNQNASALRRSAKENEALLTESASSRT